VIVGIIGGTGKIGSLFRGVFERAGHEVIVSGRSTVLTGRQLVDRSDIVVVSVPIRSTVPVIEEIAPFLREDQLICDLTSLKVLPVAAMCASSAQVIGLHPMFGPSVSSLKNQTVIVTPARSTDAALSGLLHILKGEGAVLTITTPEAHDRMMATVQGLNHFLILAMAETIRREGVSVRQSLEFMSPVYRMQLGLIGRILGQDPDLYADILQVNPYVPEVLAQCEASVQSLRKTVVTGDPEEFRSMFLENTAHFQSYLAHAADETDALIECMVRL
jgi:prephenate dehydrogenase